MSAETKVWVLEGRASWEGTEVLGVYSGLQEAHEAAAANLLLVDRHPWVSYILSGCTLGAPTGITPWESSPSCQVWRARVTEDLEVGSTRRHTLTAWEPS